jgi:hypothetical protein
MKVVNAEIPRSRGTEAPAAAAVYKPNTSHRGHKSYIYLREI